MQEVSASEEIRLYGCVPHPPIITPSSELLEIYELIKDYDMDAPHYNKESLRSVLKKSREFFSRYYKLHKVPFEYFKKIGPFDFSYEDDINPLLLPIKKVEEDTYYGKLGEIIIYEEPPRSVIRCIELPKEITEISTLVHIHEVTHSQDNHMSGSIKHYFNSEFLSIFNELLCANSINDGGRLAYLNDVVRLYNLKYGIKFLQDGRHKHEEWYEELAESCCYVESTVKAYNLFMEYQSSNPRIKEYIILMIQKVFDGEITLEECLEALDITYQNSLNPKKLAKFLQR